MAHGTPVGIADNDERYGAQGAFMIEAGISSSYHIAGFFGLTGRIHQPGEASKPIAAAPTSTTITVPPASFLRRLRRLRRRSTPFPGQWRCHPAMPSRAGRRGVRAIDVGAVITRALTAAGLMK